MLNKSFGNSLTMTSKLSTKTTLRFLSYYNDDEIDFEKFNSNRFNLETNPITIEEQITANDYLRDIYGNIELNYFNNKNWYFTFESKWLRERNSWDENIISNNLVVPQANNQNRAAGG